MLKNKKLEESAGSVALQRAKAPKRVYNVAPERKVSNSAMIRYHRMPQPLQNTGNKRLCVQQVILSHPHWVSDEAHFWAWLVDQTKLLTRVWDFEETCEKYGLDMNSVAQHLVLEGQKACNFVRMNGLAAYGERIKLFHQPLIEMEQVILKEAGKVAIQKEEGHE